MTVAIDAAGRLVIPKALREAAGIRPGVPLEIRFRDGRVEIEPAPMELEIVAQGAVAVAVPAQPVPVLRAEDVAAVSDRLRDERG